MSHSPWSTMFAHLSVYEFSERFNCSMFSCWLLCVHSSFAIISMGKTELVALLCFVFLVSRDCCVALPPNATGLSAVCDCGIF